MNDNFSRLTHAIDIYCTFGYVPVSNESLDYLSNKMRLIHSYLENPNPIKEVVPNAENMLEVLSDNNDNEFTNKCISSVMENIPNSEGYIVCIPKLYYETNDRLELIKHIPRPNEFLEDVKYFHGNVNIIRHSKDGKVYSISEGGFLLTFYNKKLELEINSTILISGIVSKLKFNDPWETRLTKVKYV